MIISLVVHGAPYNSPAPLTAYRFARAALEAGHDLRRVFFYHDGVLTGSSLIVNPQEELDVHRLWVELHEQTGVELAVCIAASLKRGMLDATEAERYAKPAASLDDAFVIAGLGMLIEAAIESDRLITFSA